jgi:DNA-binding MarR family transcriptional regulator
MPFGMQMQAHAESSRGGNLDAAACGCYAAPMSHDLHPSTTAIWNRLLQAGAQIEARIEAALKAGGLPPLGWYDALWEIEKASDGIRPLVLQEQLQMPQYGLSRLVERLVKAGLVRRLACDADGRGQILAITDEGRDVRARMWPVYAGVLASEIEDRLQPAQALGLARGLGRLLDGAVRDSSA